VSIEKALTLLPDRERIAFECIEFGLTQEEIAGGLGCSHQHVSRLYHRARKKLQEILSE
jgi:RNA polymerase sigma factor (sigma-70 family)